MPGGFGRARGPGSARECIKALLLFHNSTRCRARGTIHFLTVPVTHTMLGAHIPLVLGATKPSISLCLPDDLIFFMQIGLWEAHSLRESCFSLRRQCCFLF